MSDRPSRAVSRAGRTRFRPRYGSTLCEALNRILDMGAVVHGEVIISPTWTWPT